MRLYLILKSCKVMFVVCCQLYSSKLSIFSSWIMYYDLFILLLVKCRINHGDDLDWIKKYHVPTTDKTPLLFQLLECLLRLEHDSIHIPISKRLISFLWWNQLVNNLLIVTFTIATRWHICYSFVEISHSQWCVC